MSDRLFVKTLLMTGCRLRFVHRNRETFIGPLSKGACRLSAKKGGLTGYPTNCRQQPAAVTVHPLPQVLTHQRFVPLEQGDILLSNLHCRASQGGRFLSLRRNRGWIGRALGKPTAATCYCNLHPESWSRAPEICPAQKEDRLRACKETADRDGWVCRRGRARLALAYNHEAVEPIVMRRRLPSA